MFPVSLAALALFTAAVPAQQHGVFVFDFSTEHRAGNAENAQRVVADAQDIVDAVVVLCSTSLHFDGVDHRQEVTSLLLDAGAAQWRVYDVGTCDPDITGGGNDQIGNDRVWLAVTNRAFLEAYLQRRRGG